METWTIESFAASGYPAGYIALLVVAFVIANTLGLVMGARVAAIPDRSLGRALGSTLVIVIVGGLVWWLVGQFHGLLGIVVAYAVTVPIVRMAYRGNWAQALVTHSVGLLVGLGCVIPLAMWLAGPQAAAQPIAPEPERPQEVEVVPPEELEDTPTVPEP